MGPRFQIQLLLHERKIIMFKDIYFFSSILHLNLILLTETDSVSPGLLNFYKVSTNSGLLNGKRKGNYTLMI